MNMALRINPYTPGVGMVPRYLAGREALLEEAKDTLAYVANGYATRSLIYYGLRGVGKTVLLTEIESIVQENNIYYEHIEAMENASFMSSISLVLIAAGLPKIAKIAGDIKSYAERLFKFIPVDKLQEDDAKQALIQPVKKLLINLFLDKVVVTDKQIDIKLTTDAISNMLTK